MTEIRAIVCGHIFRNERQVKIVVRHSDGEWQLVCGEHDHPQDCSDFEVIGLEHLVERQPNIVKTGELRPGWMAEWTDGRWIFTVHDD